MPNCYKCSAELNSDTDFGRQESCTKCGFSTHCCRNCIFFDLSKYNECAESNADRVVDKEKANFCDYFKPGNQKGAINKAQSAKEAAEALFKKLK
jgi:hypothetical protein